MKRLALYIDLAFCLVVLPVMAELFPVERWLYNFPWYVATVGAWLYLLYVVNRRLTVPCLFRGGRRWQAAALIGASLAVTFALSQVNLYSGKPSVHDAGVVRVFPKVLQYQQAVWSLFMIVEAFSFAVGLLTQATRLKAQHMELEAERDKAELELYKAQIKPHFMFNTLNSLYGLFLTRNPRAMESLEKYISMLRYIHTTSGRDMVPLCHEADYIRQYVELQSLRLNEKTHVELSVEVEDTDSLPVPPMLLVTFVENCFKHGVSPDEAGTIAISLCRHGSEIRFSTSNRIFPTVRTGEHRGIENCRRRLQLLFPGRHSLSTGGHNGIFTVKLSIRYD